MTKNILLISIFLYSTSVFADTTIYESVDEQGNISFSNIKPEQSRDVEQTYYYKEQSQAQKQQAQEKQQALQARSQEISKNLQKQTYTQPASTSYQAPYTTQTNERDIPSSDEYYIGTPYNHHHIKNHSVRYHHSRRR